jgi:hypothetical protein
VSEDTRGLTIREIVLEIREDVKEHMDKGHANTPTRAELYGTLIALGGVVLAAFNV